MNIINTNFEKKKEETFIKNLLKRTLTLSLALVIGLSVIEPFVKLEVVSKDTYIETRGATASRIKSTE